MTIIHPIIICKQSLHYLQILAHRDILFCPYCIEIWKCNLIRSDSFDNHILGLHFCATSQVNMIYPRHQRMHFPAFDGFEQLLHFLNINDHTQSSLCISQNLNVIHDVICFDNSLWLDVNKKIMQLWPCFHI